MILCCCCGNVQYIFQQVVNGYAIEHHLWMLQPMVTTYKVQDLTRDQSEALRQRFRFVLLGATATSKSSSTETLLPYTRIDSFNDVANPLYLNALFVFFCLRRPTEHVKRFTKREKKLKPKCLPNSGCPKKIRRLERNLVLQEVTSRRACLPIEVEANTR